MTAEAKGGNDQVVNHSLIDHGNAKLADMSKIVDNELRQSPAYQSVRDRFAKSIKFDTRAAGVVLQYCESSDPAVHLAVTDEAIDGYSRLNDPYLEGGDWFRIHQNFFVAPILGDKRWGYERDPNPRRAEDRTRLFKGMMSVPVSFRPYHYALGPYDEFQQLPLDYVKEAVETENPDMLTAVKESFIENPDSKDTKILLFKLLRNVPKGGSKNLSRRAKQYAPLIEAAFKDSPTIQDKLKAYVSKPAYTDDDMGHFNGAIEDFILGEVQKFVDSGRDEKNYSMAHASAALSLYDAPYRGTDEQLQFLKDLASSNDVPTQITRQAAIQYNENVPVKDKRVEAKGIPTPWEKGEFKRQAEIAKDATP